jgi:hypothetical protein
MKRDERTHSVISAQELDLLLGSKKGQATGVDPRFKYRNAFVLVAASLLLVRAFFFPEVVARQLNLLSSVGDISFYVQMRGLLAFVVTAFYCFSYLKDWHCAKVSLVISAFSFIWLVADSFSFGRFGIGPMQPVMVGTFLLRAGVVYCLFMNAVRDDRAPAMPRTLLS